MIRLDKPEELISDLFPVLGIVSLICQKKYKVYFFFPIQILLY